VIKAEYIQHAGTDLTVVNAARVSFDKEGEWDQIVNYTEGADGELLFTSAGKALAHKDEKLIGYLAKHNHFTPFTHCTITLRETVPIFVARQRFKHTVGFSYNEVSRRYVDSDPEFFVPDVWRKRADNKKQGSTDEEVTDYTSLWAFDSLGEDYHSHCAEALTFYKHLIAKGVCPEQARMVLPQSMMTSYYVTGSLAAFARLYKLRIDPHSQKEIQDLAGMIGTVIEPLFPVSWKALTE
jgi:thymidylate synthase (FAD)